MQALLDELASFGWDSVTVFTDPNTYADAFAGDFDVIMVGTGDDPGDASSIAANNALIALQEEFADYINSGGALYVHTDEEFGQSWYDFIPSFGETTNNTISPHESPHLRICLLLPT